MDLISFVVARNVVARYNELRDCRKVARELQVPHQTCFAIVDWLWNRTYPRHVDLVGAAPKGRLLPELKKLVWLEYLYTNDVSLEAAAESVGWAIDEVKRTCKGPQEWNRPCKRAPLSRARPCKPEDDGSAADMTEEEIYARALEVRLAREPITRPGRAAAAEARRFMQQFT